MVYLPWILLSAMVTASLNCFRHWLGNLIFKTSSIPLFEPKNFHSFSSLFKQSLTNRLNFQHPSKLLYCLPSKHFRKPQGGKVCSGHCIVFWTLLTFFGSRILQKEVCWAGKSLSNLEAHWKSLKVPEKSHFTWYEERCNHVFRIKVGFESIVKWLYCLFTIF